MNAKQAQAATVLATMARDADALGSLARLFSPGDWQDAPAARLRAADSLQARWVDLDARRYEAMMLCHPEGMPGAALLEALDRCEAAKVHLDAALEALA